MKDKRDAILTLLFAGVALVYLVLSVFSADWRIIRMVYLIFPASAALVSVRAAKQYKGSDISPLSLVAGGVSLWFIAEGVRFYLMLKGINEYPNAADAVFLLGYPLMLIGLYRSVTRIRSSMKSSNSMRYGAAIVVLLSAASIYYAVIAPFSSSAAILKSGTDIFYAAGDIIMIVAALRAYSALLKVRGGQLAETLVFFIVGVCLKFLGEVVPAVFGEYEMSGALLTGFIDLIRMGAYAMFAFSFYNLSNANSDAYGRIGELRDKIKVLSKAS